MKIQKKMIVSLTFAMIIIVSLFTINTQAVNETNNTSTNTNQSRKYFK